MYIKLVPRPLIRGIACLRPNSYKVWCSDSLGSITMPLPVHQNTASFSFGRVRYKLLVRARSISQRTKRFRGGRYGNKNHDNDIRALCDGDSLGLLNCDGTQRK